MIAVVVIAAVVLASVVLFLGRADSAPNELVFDAEFNYVGAVRTWVEPGSTEDPFLGVEDTELVAAGRTVCQRAGDEEMDFNGMSSLLGMTPHQTYAVLAETADKLCPSQNSAISRVMEE